MPEPTLEALQVWHALPQVYFENLKQFEDEHCDGDRKQFAVDKFTCADCPHVKTCEYVFDLYNTNGYCLALK